MGCVLKVWGQPVGGNMGSVLEVWGHPLCGNIGNLLKVWGHPLGGNMGIVYWKFGATHSVATWVVYWTFRATHSVATWIVYWKFGATHSDSTSLEASFVTRGRYLAGEFRHMGTVLRSRVSPSSINWWARRCIKYGHSRGVIKRCWLKRINTNPSHILRLFLTHLSLAFHLFSPTAHLHETGFKSSRRRFCLPTFAPVCLHPSLPGAPFTEVIDYYYYYY